ncbi:MAG: oligosaccharide flippase family protein [Planctomycetes bacterium]|nr:oligosaccharide flippase family protein [Planctomycetota bacterium]
MRIGINKTSIFDLRERKRMFKSEFKRNVLILTIGTAFSQGLMVLASPLLTRLFTPEDFGLFAIFVSISSILVIIATGRYDSAIILPEKDDDAVNIVSLTVLITAVLSGLFLIAFLIFNAQITKLLGTEEISSWLYFIPVNVFFTCLFTILCNWLTRNKRFRGLAFSKIAKSFVIVGLSVLFGILQFGASGLIIGLISGHLLISLLMLGQIWFKDGSKRKIINSKRMKEQANKYKDFPKWNILTKLVNTLANRLPIIIFGICFTSAIAGFYALTQMVLGAPVSLIAVSISDVFKQRAASEYAKHGNCRVIFLKTLKKLVIISFVPFIILFLTAPDIFSFIFGEKWRESGVYAQILSILLFFRFFSNSIGEPMYLIARKLKTSLLFHSLFLLFSLISIAIGIIAKDIKIALICFSVFFTIIYIVYLLLSYVFSQGEKT